MFEALTRSRAAGYLCAATMILSGCAASMPMKSSSAARPAVFAANQSSGGAGAGPTAVAATTSTTRAGSDSTPQVKEQIMVSGSIGLAVNDVSAAAARIRKHVKAANGRVVNENLYGGTKTHRGSLQVRVPPAGVQAMVDVLDDLGEITSKSIRGTDVSKTLFDQKIALDNLTRTLERMRKLLDRPGLDMKQVLAIEQQMTRLRGQIESIKGSRRYLKDKVALATIDIQLTRRKGAVFGPKAKVYPGPRFSTLTLLDANGRQRLRLGGGLQLRFPDQPNAPRGSLELDLFRKDTDDPNSKTGVLVTIGGAAYSDFLGRGQRRWLNPYLGFRMGYGYLDRHYFAAGVGGGVELFKHEYVLIDANVRAMMLIRDSLEPTVVTGLAAVFAF